MLRSTSAGRRTGGECDSHQRELPRRADGGNGLPTTMPRSPAKVIPSKQTADVFLTIGGMTWSRVETSVRERLCDALETVARVRRSIAASAKVQSMPLVQIVPELWYDIDHESIIDGCAGPIRRGEYTHFAARLPAQTATIADEHILRRVLVHEFTHCFYYMEYAVLFGPDSESNLEGDQWSDADDRKAMVDPTQWFGQADVDEFLYHEGLNYDEKISSNLVELVGKLPTGTPPGRFKISSLAVPDDVHAHILACRAYHRPSAPPPPAS